MAGASPQVISGRISFAISFLAGTLFFLMSSYPDSTRLFYSALFFAIVFLFSFFILRFSIEQFIQEKLSLIYKTIHQLKRKPTDSNEKGKVSANAIERVNEEVLDWHLDNKKEIDRLTVLEQYRREFIGNVSHELKTPVFNIQGYLLTLLEGGLEDETINRKYLERAEKSVEKLIKLLNELDIIIRLDTGEINLNLKRFNIIELVKEVIESNELKAKDRKINLKINRKNMEPLLVMADEDKIAQVLTNLVINSIKYGKEKGQTEISFHDMKNQVLIEIKDNGIGIKDHELSRVFDRFYRTESGRSVDHKGFGLGLSIVKHIIESHEQVIHVNSVEKEGSTFSFTLNKVGKR